MKVNVGTIGHIDQGKTTLTAALIKVLGEKTAGQVVVMDEAGIDDARRRGLIAEDADLYVVSPSGSGRSTPKKKARKARMQDLQRRAFLKEPRP